MDVHRQRWSLAILAALAAVTLLVNSGLPTVAQTVPRPDTIIIDVEAGTASLDPAVVFDPTGVHIVWQIYEPLVWFDRDTMRVVPWLAERWEQSSDGLTYTFHLRRGIRFHDGTPFNARAVKFSIERMILMAQPRGGASYYRGVLRGAGDYLGSKRTPEDVNRFLQTGGLRVVDDYTIAFHLERPFPAFPLMLALHFVGGIISPEFVQRHGGVTPGELNSEVARLASGTGPYVLREFDVGTGTARLEAFPGYWGGPGGRGPARVRNIIIRPVAEPLTRVLNLKAGTSDMALLSPAQLFEFADERVWRRERRLVSTVKGVDVSGPFLLNRIEAIMLNAAIKDAVGNLVGFQPFKDRRVREALGHAFNYSAYINELLKGFGVPIGSPIPRGWFGYDEMLQPPPYNLERARRLLLEAGRELGFAPDAAKTVELFYPAGEADSEAALFLLASAVKGLQTGLNIRPTSMTYAAFSSAFLRGQLPGIRISWVGAFPDPDGNLRAFGDGRTGILATRAGYNNPRVNELIDMQARELDPRRREALVKEAARLISQDGHYVWRAQRTTFWVQRDWIRGTYLHPTTIGPYYYALTKGR